MTNRPSATDNQAFQDAVEFIDCHLAIGLGMGLLESRQRCRIEAVTFASLT